MCSIFVGCHHPQNISTQKFYTKNLPQISAPKNLTKKIGKKDWNCMSSDALVVSGTCSCLLTKEGKTRPGQSHSLTEGVRKMVWKCLVWPGVREVLTAWK